MAPATLTQVFFQADIFSPPFHPHIFSFMHYLRTHERQQACWASRGRYSLHHLQAMYTRAAYTVNCFSFQTAWGSAVRPDWGVTWSSHMLHVTCKQTYRKMSTLRRRLEKYSAWTRGPNVQENVSCWCGRVQIVSWGPSSSGGPKRSPSWQISELTAATGREEQLSSTLEICLQSLNMTLVANVFAHIYSWLHQQINKSNSEGRVRALVLWRFPLKMMLELTESDSCTKCAVKDDQKPVGATKMMTILCGL